MAAKFDRIVLKIFLWGLVLVFLAAIGMSFLNEATIATQPPLIKTLHNLAGLIFGLWMAFALYLSARLVFSKQTRSEILPKLVLLKEEDEREKSLTGHATKWNFLVTLAILILMLCLSIFKVSVYQVQPETIDGKGRVITLDIGLGLLDKPTDQTKDDPAELIKYFLNYSGLPISKTAIILFLIIWQIASYNYFMKRLLQNGSSSVSEI